MPEYRRANISGGTYFFTVITNRRWPIFTDHSNVEILKTCMSTVKKSHPFRTDAIVILPDHLHTIWTLPEDDSDFSTRWRLIKAAFSRRCIMHGEEVISNSRKHKAERGVWQRRFWEHMIRDEEDLNRHMDYIHYNPVKHDLTISPALWKYSTFSSYVMRGQYTMDWGSNVQKEILDMDLE